MSGYQFPEHERKERTNNPKVTKLDKVAKYMGILIHIDGVAYGDLSVEGPKLNKPVKNNKPEKLKNVLDKVDQNKNNSMNNADNTTQNEVIEENKNESMMNPNVSENTEEPVKKKPGRKPGWKKNKETSQDNNEVMITTSGDT